MRIVGGTVNATVDPEPMVRPSCAVRVESLFQFKREPEMKYTLTALTAFALLAPVMADAQTAAPAAPESSLTGNFTLVSDYRFRGISQSYKLPAVQGGIDYAHSSGFYVGNWNSSVSGNLFPNGAVLEMDFYGGYKFPVGGDITMDVGALYYYYPGSYYNGFGTQRPSFNNFELYVGASTGPFSAKIYYGLSDFFGLSETTSPNGKSSKGSYYIDLNYTTEIMPKTNLIAHIGYQSVKNHSDFSYFDYKLGATYDIHNGWLLGAAVVGTNAEKGPYTFAETSNGSRTKFMGSTTVVFSIGKTF